MEKQKRVLSGKGNGFGLAKGSAARAAERRIEILKKSVTDVRSELNRWEEATDFVKARIEKQLSQAYEVSNHDEAGILTAHLALLDDPSLIESVADVIQEEMCCAEWALKTQAEKICEMLKKSNNPVIQERTLDICDLSGQLIQVLIKSGLGADDLGDQTKLRLSSTSSEKRILIKDSLFPSDVIRFDFETYGGILLAHGSWTTHAAILAKSKAIPMVILDDDRDMAHIEDGTTLILDADDGLITIHPTSEDHHRFNERTKKNEEAMQLFARIKNCPMFTGNGKKILFEANINGPEDLPALSESGAQGIGLFRTEFLYYDQASLPSENKQYKIYKEVLRTANGLPVTFRTFDIGGDKQAPSLNLPTEMNPFLGFRAIRIALAEPGLFKTQIRAILRAATGLTARIMFPMIATLDELELAKIAVYEAQCELQTEGIPCSEQLQLGMMVEIPAAAVMADVFAQNCDFFSIGTNDLVQYTMACDRMNEKVQNLYQIENPAVLRLIKFVAEAAHQNGIEVGICGEAASNIEMIPTWLEYGIDALSMSPSVLPKIQVGCYQTGLIRIEN